MGPIGSLLAGSDHKNWTGLRNPCCRPCSPLVPTPATTLSSDHSGETSPPSESSRLSLRFSPFGFTENGPDGHENSLDCPSSPPSTTGEFFDEPKPPFESSRLPLSFPRRQSRKKWPEVAKTKPSFEPCQSRIYTIHRRIGMKMRYVAPLVDTLQLTVGIRRRRLRSPATPRPTSGGGYGVWRFDLGEQGGVRLRAVGAEGWFRLGRGEDGGLLLGVWVMMGAPDGGCVVAIGFGEWGSDGGGCSDGDEKDDDGIACCWQSAGGRDHRCWQSAGGRDHGCWQS
ncbi:hypothetical protein GQ457_11G020920 [Hibiscus cannabinus]